MFVATPSLTPLVHRITPWLQSLSWLYCPTPLQNRVFPVDQDQEMFNFLNGATFYILKALVLC